MASRSDAAAWGCHVHNEVNKSLKKELFDCSNIGDFYDCGCADGEEGEGEAKGEGKGAVGASDRVAGAADTVLEYDVEVEKEG